MSSPPAETIPCFNRWANNFNLWSEQHSQRQATQLISGSLSGDRGKTAAAAEGPWSYPCANALQGLSQNANPSRISRTDPAQAQYTVSDGSVLTATPVPVTGAEPTQVIEIVGDYS